MKAVHFVLLGAALFLLIGCGGPEPSGPKLNLTFSFVQNEGFYVTNQESKKVILTGYDMDGKYQMDNLAPREFAMLPGERYFLAVTYFVDTSGSRVNIGHIPDYLVLTAHSEGDSEMSRVVWKR